IVMSDSEDSTVTYTAVSSPFGGLSDIGSLGVDGPPMMPEDPYAYVVAAFQAPPSPDYVTAEEQPLPTAASSTADSPGYVPESDPEKDTKEDDDEEREEDPADYPADGGDDGDDEDELSDDDEDDDVNIKGDEDEEEHPAPADSTGVALPAVDHAPSVEELSHETPISLPPREEVERLLAMSTPPSSPLSPWGSSPLPQGYLIHNTPDTMHHYQLRAEAASTSHSLPLPPPIILSHTRPNAPSLGTPPLHLLSTNRRVDRHEVTLPPKKRLGIALGPRYEVGESSSAAAARPTGGMPGAPVTDDTEMGRWMTEFTTRVRQDTDEIYTRDRRAHAHIARIMEAKARMSREAWGRTMDASDLARAEVMSLRTQVVAQQAVITELQAADRRRQAAITEMLAADCRRQKQFIEALKLLKILQTQMTEFERQIF
ncbi:hypothetical protein Tco_0859859, partial [Tanacetum coccineum]